MASLNTGNSPGEALPSGTKLQGGAYAVSRVLGQGGFGITYYGGDMKLHRYTAIKEFFPNGCVRTGNTVQPGNATTSLDFQNAKRKFLEEARALARFQHRNIAQVLTVFEENNTAYMVMEYLKGKTLMQLLQERGVLPEHEATGHIKQIGEALAAVHGANLIHRDVKPENIMVCDDGRTVLIDFGLNKKLENVGSHSTRRLTGTTRLGSESYAPPEQHLTHAPVGAFTDIYALGATLYHLLTGNAPVPAPERAMGTDLMSPERINPNVSRTVSDAVMRAMELKGEQRPQSVQAFVELLNGKATAASAGAARTTLHSPQSLHPTLQLSPQGASPQGPAQQGAFPAAWPQTQIISTNPANASGMGNASTLPAELRGFNWGAFLLGGIWPIAHNTWIGLLVWVPYVGFVMSFALGFKGNEWAWQNRKWESIEQFKQVQKRWAYWGAGIIPGIALLTVLFLTVLGRKVEPAFDSVSTFNPATQSQGQGLQGLLAASPFISPNGYQITPASRLAGRYERLRCWRGCGLRCSISG